MLTGQQALVGGARTVSASEDVDSSDIPKIKKCQQSQKGGMLSDVCIEDELVGGGNQPVLKYSCLFSNLLG